MSKLKDVLTSERTRKGLNTVMDFAKKGVSIAIPIMAMTLYNKTADKALGVIKYSGNVGYDDAVDVIMNSTMFGSDKVKAVSLLKKDGNSEYYRAVISVIESNMFGSDKLKAIENLNDNE